MSVASSSFLTAPRFAGELDLTPPIVSRERWDPRRDRHAINLRWLAATSLIAVASAALMLGVLHAALRGTAKAYAPTIAVLPDSLLAPSEANGRGNRLPPVTPAPDHRNVQVHQFHLEQMRSSGSGVVPFTYLVAQLGRDAPTEPAAPGPKSAEVASAADPVARLPPEILLGGSNIKPPSKPIAYAAASSDIEPGPRGTPLNVTHIARSRRSPDEPDRVIVAQRGDKIETMLSLLGMAPSDVSGIAAALAPASGAQKAFAGGEKIMLRQDKDQPGSPRPAILHVERTDGSIQEAALADSGHYVRVATPVQTAGSNRHGAPGDGAIDADMPDHGSVRDSLYALSQHNIANQPLVDELVRLSSAYADLGDPVSPNDTAEFLYSAETQDGDADPVLDFTSLTIDGETHRFYRFETADDGSVDYYDADGRSVTKFLLRKPVANGRLGDGFGWRIHPVLGDRRFHQGVDYAAPYGSPIVAAGAGVVEKIDSEAGYGKYIRVRHDLGYETTYAHVAGFPSNMHIGTRVRQGETVAFIGSTGLSTGPHLYYEVKINGRNVDPLRIRLQAGRILQGDVLASFERRRERLDVLIRASTNGTDAAKTKT